LKGASLQKQNKEESMEIFATEIPDLMLARLFPHRDERGFFAETWRQEWEKKFRMDQSFIQDNHVRSESKGVLRGLHFQTPPHAQSKLVWVTRGAAYDVAVDLRLGSPTYGAWHGVVLSGENMLRFFLPKGFAHGYMVLEAGTEFQYKVDAYHAPGFEGGILWNDPSLAIPWPALRPLLAEKDTLLPLMKAFESPFTYRKKQ
jgi:dTDP-4-dehydrorhamnose 3,5-epimerase